jgi:hypothetical protein
MLMSSAFFWDITQRRAVIVHLEDGTDTLSRNVGEQLLHDTA